MAAAARAPLPHSIFLGRERVSRTTFVYDDAGRLAESITVHDAEWLPEDVHKALGWDVWQQHPHHCPSGHLLAPWLGEDGEELRDPPYEVAMAFCPACELIDDDRESRKDDARQAGAYPILRGADDEEVG